MSDANEVHKAVSDNAGFWLAAIAESSNDAIVGKDLNGVVTSWNRAAAAMFGYALAEIVGQPITHIVPSDRIEEEASILERVRRGERLVHFETQRLCKDGRVIPVSLTISPIRDDQGRMIGVSKIARDLTERHERERQLNALQAELAHVGRVNDLGQMVAALAHEVNQPLTAITGNLSRVEWLLAANEPERAHQALEQAEDEADRARQIVQRLRDQINKGSTKRHVESLLPTIEQACSLALIGVRPGLDLEIQVAPDAAEAVIDKIQIQQVLVNLIRNAAEAMAPSETRKISITAALVGDEVAISVADNGPGLSSYVRARLFQSFVTTKPNGMGVGLSICRNIIQAHGGDLRAEDRNGEGTVFRFTIPRAENGHITGQATPETISVVVS